MSPPSSSIVVRVGGVTHLLVAMFGPRRGPSDRRHRIVPVLDRLSSASSVLLIWFTSAPRRAAPWPFDSPSGGDGSARALRPEPTRPARLLESSSGGSVECRAAVRLSRGTCARRSGPPRRALDAPAFPSPLLVTPFASIARQPCPADFNRSAPALSDPAPLQVCCSAPHDRWSSELLAALQHRRPRAEELDHPRLPCARELSIVPVGPLLRRARREHPLHIGHAAYSVPSTAALRFAGDRLNVRAPALRNRPLDGFWYKPPNAARSIRPGRIDVAFSATRREARAVAVHHRVGHLRLGGGAGGCQQPDEQRGGRSPHSSSSLPVLSPCWSLWMPYRSMTLNSRLPVVTVFRSYGR